MNRTDTGLIVRCSSVRDRAAKTASKHSNTDFTEKKIKPQIYTKKIEIDPRTYAGYCPIHAAFLRLNLWLNLLLGEICVEMLALLHRPPARPGVDRT